SGEAGLRVQLRLVAGADLRAVLVHHLADQLGIDRPAYLWTARPEADLRVRLAAQPALSVSVIRQAAADAVGADPRQAQSGTVAAAAGAAQRLETHAAAAARLGHPGPGEVAHGVARPLLQGDAEHVAGALPHPERLQEAAVGDDGPLVVGALGARVAARSGLAARLAFLPGVPGHGLARILAALHLGRLLRQRHRVGLLGRSAHHKWPGPDHFRLAVDLG